MVRCFRLFLYKGWCLWFVELVFICSSGLCCRVGEVFGVRVLRLRVLAGRIYIKF